MNEQQYLSSKQVSEYLNVPLRTIQKLAKQGKIKSVKVGKQWRYCMADIERFLQSGGSTYDLPSRRPDSFSHGSDRRVFPRINSNLKCRYEVKILPFKNISEEGLIKNISAGGVCLTGEKDVLANIQSDDPANMEFSLDLGEGETKIVVKGRVVRKDGICLGIKFRGISESLKNKINAYIG